ALRPSYWAVVERVPWAFKQWAGAEKGGRRMRGAWKHMRALWLVAGAAQAVLVGSGSRALRAQERDKHEGERGQHPITIAKQGSFAFGGTVLTSPGTFDPTAFVSTDGNTLHGDHGYVQFQIQIGRASCRESV